MADLQRRCWGKPVIVQANLAWTVFAPRGYDGPGREGPGWAGNDKGGTKASKKGTEVSPLPGPYHPMVARTETLSETR